MKSFKLKLAEWLLQSSGYKYVAVYYKLSKGNDGPPQYELGMEGDRDFMQYVDVAGFVLNKKPLTRETK